MDRPPFVFFSSFWGCEGAIIMTKQKKDKVRVSALVSIVLIGMMCAFGTVSAGLNADFSVVDECGLIGLEYPDGDTLTLVDGTTTTDGESVVSWSWTTTHGYVSHEQNPPAIGPVTGPDTFDITLTVTGSYSNVSTVTKTVNILNNPMIKANFSWIVDYDKEPLGVRFIDQSETSGHNIAGWYWNISGTTYKNVQMPEVRLSDSENHKVILVIVTDQGEFSRIEKTIGIHSLTKGYDPVANFTFVKVPNEPFAIQFIDQSFGSTPLTYQWTFGDNNRSAEKSPKYLYSHAGTYTVTLNVTDQFNKNATKSQDILVPSVSPPVADFDYTINPNQIKQVQFIDRSRGEITSWKWSFGDDLGSSLQSPEHLYTSYKTYNVTLTAGNSAGSHSITKTITIENPIVQAGFSWEDLGNRTIKFYNNSIGPVKEYILEYGDGKVDRMSDDWSEIEHVYAQLGRYYARLTVSNQYNADSITQTIEVLKK